LPVGWTIVTLEIMMPFYGRVDHFQQAVASILAQSDPDWRLTIIDDVYPDRAPGEWAKAIGDKRVRYVRNKTNLGPSGNFNESAIRARGEFVVIMGCDDIMLPGYVARVKELIAGFPDADIIQPGVATIDENGLPSRPLADRVKDWYRPSGHGARTYRGEKLAVSLLRGNWAYFPSVAWRTSRLTEFGFRTDVNVVQDLAMLMAITRAGGTLVLDDTVVFNYRRHSTSVSAVTGPDGSKFVEEQRLFDECAAAFDDLGWRRAARVARIHLSSRLHAATELPGALLRGNSGGRRALLRHLLGRPGRARRAL
jgi:glycosyltransferase involved in cell wall biosynthesis